MFNKIKLLTLFIVSTICWSSNGVLADTKVASSQIKLHQESQDYNPDRIIQGETHPGDILKESESETPVWIVRLHGPSGLEFQQWLRSDRSKSIAQKASAEDVSAIQSHVAEIKNHQHSFVNRLSQSGLDISLRKSFTRAINAISVNANEDITEILRNHPDVASVTKSKKYKPFLWNSVRAIKADKVWAQNDAKQQSIRGKGIKVAILDTGIDYTHPDLGGCFGEGCKVAEGYDFVNDDPDPIEDEEYYSGLGHGTHVAGIVAADGEVTGVAPDATLFAYKVCGLDNCPEEFILSALERALDPDGDPLTDDAADVINLSLGNRYGSPDDPVPTAINEISEAGVLVVVAAGNDSTYGVIGDIAAAEKAITVGSVDSDFDEVAEFSSYGPVKNVSYVKPEILAPGDSIYSTDVNPLDEYRYGVRT